MKPSLRRLSLALALALTTCVSGQSAIPDVATPGAAATTDSLSKILPSCGGARESIGRASAEVRTLDVQLTREVREQILCLLDGINYATFDNLFAFEYTRVIVMAYSSVGLDFFAEQLPQQPERVRVGLSTILLERGHPTVVRSYFESRRAKLAAGETWDRENSLVVGVFSSFLEDGKCASGVCSEHVAETLAIIQANLDIIDMELAAVEKGPTPQSPSPETAERAQQAREEASRLRGLVARIQRGEVPLGTAGRTK